MLFALVVLALASLATPARLPSYITACKRNDPKLSECALKRGIEAIPNLINGDTKLGIPKLDPLEIEKVVVGDGKSGSGLGITLTCYKCKVSGLRDVKLEDAKIDLKKQYVELKASVPTLGVRGRYTADGKVLILPIKGDGQANVTLGDMHLVYKTNYDLKKGKDGKDHLKLKNPKLEFRAEKFKIHLTNLFNGDKTLGNQMNTFLNENWQDVLKEFTPAVAETVSQVIYLIVDSIADKVPFDEIFPK